MKLMNSIHERRKFILALSCLVVFVTTYVLILPAFTLDKEEAAEQGGIDVPVIETEEKTTEESASDSGLVFVGKDYSVSVSGNNKELSDGTSVEVSEILADDKAQAKQYESLYNDALNAVRSEDSENETTDISFAKFYNFALMDGKKEAKLSDKVDVTITYEKEQQKELAVSDSEDVRVLQFSENKSSGELEASVLDNNDVDVKLDEGKVEEAAFAADNSSVIAIVGTETLSTEVITASGETYEISLSYGPEAGIPEGAELYASEITDEDLYNSYMEKAAAEVSENGDNNVLSARFFDIEIRSGDEVIEPKEAVSVSIKYDEQVVLGEDETMSAVHFGEEKIDVTEVKPVNKEGGTEVTFDQNGFSITGTVITSGVISNGDYYILYKNGNNYYALANDGSAVQVTVQDGVVVDESERTDLIWTRTGQSWRGAGNTRYYVNPANNQAVNYYNANLTLTKQDDGTYIISNGNRYLRYSNGGFTGGSNSNSHMILARVDEPYGVNIHYGYLDDSGNFVEWTDKEVALRKPDMLGDQYDVKQDIPGYEYVTARLRSSTGTPIINLLQTQTNKAGTQQNPNNPVSTGNNTTAAWCYKQLTTNNTKYGSWQDQFGTDFDYLRGSELNDDIYVVYRKDPKQSGQSSGDSDLEDIDAPKISKEKQDNEDGTYDIDLSITAEAASEKKSGRANVVIVLDSSNSMTDNNSPKWRYATNAIKALSTKLLGLNEGSGDDSDRVEFAFVNFSNYVKNESWIYSVGADNKNEHIYTDPVKFNNMINGLNTFGGTCWDKAMAAAGNILWDDNDPVYVVFISDGDTNSRAYANGNYDLWDGGTYVDATYSTDYDNNVNAKMNVDSATAFADKIRSKGGTVFTVGITGGGNLVNLYRVTHGTEQNHPYHFDATNESDLIEAFDSIEHEIMKTLGYQDVEITDGLTGMTSTALVGGNAGNFSYTVAKYNEAVTKLTELPEGAAVGSRTTDDNGTITAYMRNTGSDKDTYPYLQVVRTVAVENGVKQEATVVENNNGTLSITFPGENTPDIVGQASYAEDTKKVTWDLNRSANDHYQLRDGYTYTVSFTVWPNQASYDLIAALKNGIIDWGDPFTYSDEEGNTYTIPFAEYSKQIDNLGNNTYALRSNVESGNTVDYYKVSTETLERLPDGASIGQSEDPETHVITIYSRNSDGTITKTVKTPGSADFTNPEPMPLAGTTLDITKVWDDSLDPSHLEELIAKAEAEGKKYGVTLKVYQNADTEAYQTYRFEPVAKYYTDDTYTVEADGETEFKKYVWPSQKLNIAPALLVNTLPDGVTEEDGQYKTVTLYPDEDSDTALGRYYVLNDGHQYTIKEEGMDFHFQFEADPYHPSLVNSASELRNVHFTTNDTGAIVGDDSKAYIDGRVPLETFTATNSLTSELDITKKIDDANDLMTQAEEDAETFTYKVTLTVPYDESDPDKYTQFMYAYEWVPRSDVTEPNYTNRFYVYGYQNSESDAHKGLDDDVSRFSEKIFGRYTVSYPDAAGAQKNYTLSDMFTPDTNGDGKLTGTQTGTIYITLKQNEILRFTNLPKGTKYIVEEMYANLRQSNPSRDADAHPSAYMNGGTEIPSNLGDQGYSQVGIKTKVTTKDEDGNPRPHLADVSGSKVEGTVTALDARYYNQFTNTRTSVTDDVRAELKVKKKVEGYEWGDEYYSMSIAAGTATYSDAEGGTGTSPLPSNGESNQNIYKTTDGHTLSFGNVLYTRPGTYTYTVSEYDNSGRMPHVVFASPVTVTVTVKADDTGKLYVDDIADNKGTTKFDHATNTALASGTTVITNTSKRIKIKKVDKDQPETQLEGAVFELNRKGASKFEKVYIQNNIVLDAAGVEEQIGMPVTDAKAGAAMEKKGIASTFTIGEIELGGLTFDTAVYQLHEVSAPDNYVITDGTVYFKVNSSTGTISLTDESGTVLTDDEEHVITDNDQASVTVEENSLEIRIKNQQGAELPHAGGIGTTIFYILGSMLTLGCAVFMISRKRLLTAEK